MNQEVAVIDVIERILSMMLENEWQRARVTAYFADKYPQAVPEVEAAAAEWGMPATPAVPTAGGVNSSGGWGWGGMP